MAPNPKLREAAVQSMQNKNYAFGPMPHPQSAPHPGLWQFEQEKADGVHKDGTSSQTGGPILKNQPRRV